MRVPVAGGPVATFKLSVMSVDPSKRYDRQIRIWGVSGQSRLERTKVLLLNCSPTGSGAMHGHASAAAAAAAFTAPSCENPDLRCFDLMMVVAPTSETHHPSRALCSQRR